MSIDEAKLLEERKALEEDYKSTEERIKLIEAEVGKLKSNLNAIFGAIQQTDKFLTIISESKKFKEEKKAEKKGENA